MNTTMEKMDYEKIKCSLCPNQLPVGALFTFMKCKKCGDIIHDACHMYLAPKIIEDFKDHQQLWYPFCQICGLNEYFIITPQLWKTPIGKIIESQYMWNGDWTNYI